MSAATVARPARNRSLPTTGMESIVLPGVYPCHSRPQVDLLLLRKSKIVREGEQALSIRAQEDRGRSWAADQGYCVRTDLTAARTHRIVKTCVRLRIPALADMAYTGAGGTFAVPVRRPARKELSAGQRSLNRAHARLLCPVERGVATVKRWKIFQHARCSPNWLTSAAKAVLTLELQR